MSRVFPAASTTVRSAAPSLTRRVLEAPTPGTGSGFVSFFDDRIENLLARDWINDPQPVTARTPEEPLPADPLPADPLPLARTPGMAGALGGAF
jgi:hypothetical protein